MVDEYDVYKAYIVTKAHFTSKGGLAYKKRIRSCLPIDDFVIKHGRHMSFYKAVARQHRTFKDICFAMATNFLHINKFHITDYDHDYYNHHMKIVGAIFKYFCDDLENLSPRDFQSTRKLPPIVRKTLGGEINYETVYIINYLSGFFDEVDKYIENEYVWDGFKQRLLRYGSFLNIEDFDRFRKAFSDWQATHKGE